MARVKPKRQGFHIDMTPMSDMAWLLLTFFILTTQFRKPEVVPVKTPGSVSTQKVQDGGLVEIIVNSDGQYYFGIIDDKNKKPILEKMGEKYKIDFTEQEKNSFYSLSEVTVPIGSLKQFLNMEPAQQKQNIPGIKLDSANLQLMDWIDASFEVDPELKLAIKGDVNTQYPKFRELVKELVNRDYNRFQLITSSEAKPKE
ncbi:MAG: biopolymer transporter ExbD [Flavobacteriia bacterium]|nr:biopolymer transporter ExbD [Flavobacteriia bacterium]